MTYLSLFGSVGTEHGLDQNDASHQRHHSHNANQDLFAQNSNSFLSPSLHVLPHQTPHSLQDPPTSAASHERTTANHANHTFFDTLSASMAAKSASGLHIPPRPKPRGSPGSSSSGGGGSSKRKYSASPPADLDPDSEEAQVVIKRQRNTMAARKYRQKRLDRISDLESALGEVSSERDELKLQLARREAEVEALREMLARK